MTLIGMKRFTGVKRPFEQRKCETVDLNGDIFLWWMIPSIRKSAIHNIIACTIRRDALKCNRRVWLNHFFLPESTLKDKTPWEWALNMHDPYFSYLHTLTSIYVYLRTTAGGLSLATSFLAICFKVTPNYLKISVQIISSLLPNVNKRK